MMGRVDTVSEERGVVVVQIGSGHNGMVDKVARFGGDRRTSRSSTVVRRLEGQRNATVGSK